jgi:hypothetical protein
MLIVMAGTAGAGENELDAEIGLGYDDNAFLSPSEPYFDQFSQTVVAPVPTSGWFVPARVSGDYRSSDSAWRFVTQYRLRSDLYLQSSTRNANETYAKVAPGFERVFGPTGRRENVLAVRPFLLYNNEVYFDRDTGQDFQGAGDRYSYTALGADVEYTWRTHERIEIGTHALYENRDYEEVPGSSSLDHDRYRVGVDLEFEVSPVVNLYVDYDYQGRDYDVYPSRDLTGTALTSNPPLQYDYHFLGLSGRFRVNDAWVLYVDLDRRTRDDAYVGYNDYTQNAYRVRALNKFGSWRLRAALRFWDRSYDNAFIFDNDVNPADMSPNPHKAYDTYDLDLSASRELSSRLGLFGELDYRDQETSDPRYTYDRLRLTVGVKWTL